MMGSSASQPARKVNHLRSQITQTELSDVTKKLWIEEPIIPPSQVYGTPIIPSDIEAELNELDGFPKENNLFEKEPVGEHRNAMGLPSPFEKEEALEFEKEKEETEQEKRNKIGSRELDYEGKNAIPAGAQTKFESNQIAVQSPARLLDNEEEMNKLENFEEDEMHSKPASARKEESRKNSMAKTSYPKSPPPDIPPRLVESPMPVRQPSVAQFRNSALPPYSSPTLSANMPPIVERLPPAGKMQSSTKVLIDQLEYVRQSTPKPETPDLDPKLPPVERFGQSTPKPATPGGHQSLPPPSPPAMIEIPPKSDPPPCPRKKHSRRKSRSKKRHHHRFDPSFPQPESGPRWSPKQPRNKRRSPRRRANSAPPAKTEEKKVENPWVLAEARAKSNKTKTDSSASLGINNENLSHVSVLSSSMATRPVTYSKAIRVKNGKVERKVIPDRTWNYWTSKPGELSPVNRRQTIIL